MKTLRTLLAAALLACCATVAAASDFPTRTVRIFVPFPAGSGPDAVLRVMADKLQHRWGQPVIVEGRPGASGAIAIEAFKRGAPDGHDLLLVDGSALVLSPHLYRKLTYDPVRDFELVTPMFRTAFAVLVPQQSRLRSVPDLLAAAKAAPGKLNYGSWGTGSYAHVAGAMLESSAGARMEHVAYRDTNQLFLALAGGELDFALGSSATLNAFSGKLRALPGGEPHMAVSGWTLFAAPRGLAPALLDRLKRDLDAVLQEPDVRSRLQAFGWEPMPMGRAELPAFVAGESARYGEIIRRVRISID